MEYDAYPTNGRNCGLGDITELSELGIGSVFRDQGQIYTSFVKSGIGCIRKFETVTHVI